MKTWNLKALSTPLLLLPFIMLIPSCKNREQEPAPVKKIEFTFESHKTGDTVRRPLPVMLHGKIKNIGELQGTGKGKGPFVYILEQSTKEKIWHIEPPTVIDEKGTWRGVTWLGNRITGNRSRYNVCVFASEKELKLNNGNHPVKEKPENKGESCIELIRKD